MNFKTSWLKAWLLVLALTLVACAATGVSTFHTFTFDAFRDSRDVEVVQYRYGNDGGFNTRTTQADLGAGTTRQAANTTGEMIVGKDLYVKWRIKSTGQVLENTVDLQSRLPFTIKNHDLRFIIEGTQLYVYLISYEPVRPYFAQADADRIRAFAITPRDKALAGYARNRVTMIYPEKQVDPHIPADLRK